MRLARRFHRRRARGTTGSTGAAASSSTRLWIGPFDVKRFLLSGKAEIAPRPSRARAGNRGERGPESATWQWIGPAGVLLASALVVATSACKTDNSGYAAAGAPAAAKPVSLVAASSDTVGSSVVGNGTLAADEDASLAFKVPGRVAAVVVDLGTYVHKGDPIARLDTADYQLRTTQAEAALEQARARLGLDPSGKNDTVDAETTGTVRQARAVLDEARANRERGQQLFKTGVISKAQLDAYESAFRVAEGKYQDAVEEVRNRQGLLMQRKSELAIARQQLSDAVLVAPFDGAISERIAAVGDYLAAGAPVAKLVRLHPLRLRAEIPERDAGGVRAGQSVRVRAEGVAEDANGRVARVSPTINAQNRILVVEVEVNNERGALRPGGFARAEIATDVGTSAVTVPESAVVAFAGIEKVFVVKDGKAVERVVTTGRREGGRVEIASGLDANEAVVAEPGNLVAGQPVVVE
jgi:RND family efflux transporter MFP subunit